MIRFALRPGVRRLFRLPLRNTDAIRADIDEELASLLDARVESLVARGMSPDDARTSAVARLGSSLDLVREQLHHSAEQRERRMRFDDYLGDLAQDVRYAARGLLRRRAFTTVAVLTLAIGIGATTAIFSAVDALLLRPLPFARPDELMKVSLTMPGHGDMPARARMVWSYPKYVVFRDAQRIFSEEALYSTNQFTITAGDVERIRGEYVGATYLRTLGLAPSRGRDFDRAVDDHFGSAPQALLSARLWERRFDRDPQVIGKTINLDRKPYTIIGVAPPDFAGLSGDAEVFVPITSRPADDFSPFSHEFTLIGRRKPGVTLRQAAAAATVLGKRVDDAYPDPEFPTPPSGAIGEPLDATRVAPVVRQSLLVLFGAVAFVLLIACVNVANLLLGRAAGRRREIAVRLAIGAGSGRLVRLLLTESLLLALVGAVASVAVAWLGVHALAGVNPAITQRIQRDSGLGAVAFASITLDWKALAFTFGIALLVGVAFGLAPALHASRATLTDALKDGTPGRRSGGASAARRVLVVAEVALALVLLAGSGLMVRSLTKLLSVDTGFDGRDVLTLRLSVTPGSIPRDSIPAFYTQLLDRVRAVPGVTDAAINNCPPLNGGCNGTAMRLLEHPEIDFGHSPSVGVHWVSPTWFSTMRVPLRRGRVFATSDRVGTQQVVVVNEAAAKTLWGGADPIGKHVEVGQGNITNAEVVGIVGDVRQRADSAERPDVYLSYYQSPSSQVFVYVRSSRDLLGLAPEVRRAINEVAPQYPVYDIQTMTARASGATAQARFSATLLALFAATALSLAAIGIYGVMSLAVAARTREIGIRIALGADRSRVQRLVVGEGVGLVAVGAALGLAGALFCTRLLESLLFGLTPTDPATYAVIIVLLGVAAVIASWIPARRASRVDPVVALRMES